MGLRLTTTFGWTILTLVCSAQSASPQDLTPSDLAEAERLEKQASKLLYSDGNYDDALSGYNKALELRERIVGVTDETLIPILMGLALAQRAKGEYQMSENSYKRALSMKEEASGKVHPELRPILERYACLLTRLDRKEQAKELRARSYAIIYKSPSEPRPVTGVVVEGRRLSIPKPAYPSYLKKQRLDAVVVATVTIGEDGRVIEACASSGPPQLAIAAERAALRAKFTPTTLDGVPVKVSGAISYNFVGK